jgi:hypothetical protein
MEHADSTAANLPSHDDPGDPGRPSAELFVNGLVF